MPTDKELMQQALDALEAMQSYAAAENKGLRICDETIEALRARLAQPEPEPVAWVAYETGEKHGVDFDEDEIAELPVGTMLYTAPPQREWQSLTDEEITACIQMGKSGYLDGFVKPLATSRSVAAKLKEKNGF